MGVGFIALLGIGTDDGVIVASYPKQSHEKKRPKSTKEIHQLTVAPVLGGLGLAL